MFSKDIKTYFKRLVETPSPSGFETRCQSIFKKYASEYAEHVYEDKFGNVIAHKSNSDKPKLMISAHIDEIGFMVKHIDDEGFYISFRLVELTPCFSPDLAWLSTIMKTHF